MPKTPLLLLLAVATAATAAPPALSPADRAAAFKAAGAVPRGSGWVICADDASASATIDEVRDLNGDGRPEAVISEGGTFCHGNTGTGFVVVSKQAAGGWRLITGDTGIPTFLKSTGVGGWPDIEVGGPGFCFPVQRWNGKAYDVLRHQYEGKPCKR